MYIYNVNILNYMTSKGNNNGMMIINNIGVCALIYPTVALSLSAYGFDVFELLQYQRVESVCVCV